MTTDHLADGAVTQAKLAGDAVGAQQLQNGAVQAGKIADGAVTLTKMGGPGIVYSDPGATLTVGAQSCASINVPSVGQNVNRGDLLIASYVGSAGLPSGLYVPLTTARDDGVAQILVCNHTGSAITHSGGVEFRVRIVKG